MNKGAGVGGSDHVIEVYVPDNCEDYPGDQEEKPGDQKTAVVQLLFLAELLLAVGGIGHVFCSAHGDEGEKNVSENEADAKKRALVAYEHKSRKKRHQYARHKERVRKDLNVHSNTVGKKTL